MDKLYKGIVSLVDQETGDVLSAAVMIAETPAEITYTAQAVDRSHQETARFPAAMTCFREALRMLERVSRDRDDALA